MKRVGFLFVSLLTIGLPAIAQQESKEATEEKTVQTHSVAGKVLDEYGKGLKGAEVWVQGTHSGGVTDVNGDFIFEVPDGYNTIVFQAAGYATQYVDDEGQSLDIHMSPISKDLDGVVNTAMDFRRDRRDVGYKTTIISGDDLNVAGVPSVLSALQGKVSGANITSSTGNFGGSTRVILRGEKSFMKNSNALVVVDGVITNNYDRTRSSLNAANPAFSQLNQVDFGNSANDLEPEEIESVTVLPAAAATALYGAMGANGAIMYTTKKGKHNADGKAGKMDIVFKSTFSQSDVLKYPETQGTYGQGNMYDGMANDPREYRSWGYQFDGGLRPWGQVIDGKQLVKPYSNQPDNIRNFFNRGQNADNFLSISGGTKKSTYMLSLNSVNTSGVVPNTFYNRYGVRFNGSTELTHNLYSSVNVNYLNTYSRVETSGDGPGGVINNLYQTPRDIPIWEAKDLNSKYQSMQSFDSSGGDKFGYFNGSYNNPYWTAKNYDNRNKSDRVLGNMKLGWKKNDWHIFNRVGVDATSDRSTYNSPMYNTTGIDPLYSGINRSSAGGYAQSNYNGMRLYNDFIVNYKHQLSRNFGMTSFVGHNMTFQRDEMLAGIIDPSTGGLALPNHYNLQNNAGTVLGYNNVVNRRTVGIFYDVAFNYQKELFLDIAGRNDWSSTLLTGRQSYFYPSVNTGWVFTERLKGTAFRDHFLNYGKVRMAGGGVGNDGIPYANNNAGYTRSSVMTNYATVNAPTGVNAYQIMNTFGDNTLRPERTREFEVGADLGFLHDRLTTSFTYYRSFTSNLIASVPLPASSGYSYNYINVGDVSNNGVELSMRGTPISTRYGLRWDVFMTYTHNRNTVERVNGGMENIVLGGYNGMSVVAAEGRPLGSFYAKDIQYMQDAQGAWHAIVDQATGLPLATKDPVYKGSYQPKFMASWGTDLTYKGIRLHALFNTKQGGQFYSQTKMNMDANGSSIPTTVNNRNAYVWENSVYNVANTSIYLPNTTRFLPYDYYTKVQPQQLQAQGIVGGSFVRLQELSLSYKIPKKFYERSPFGGLEAGVYGNNLVLWTAESNKYDDPEATSAGSIGNGQGFNYIARPTTRNYGVYVKVKF